MDRHSPLLSALRAAARQAVLPRFRNLEAGQVGVKTDPTDLVTIADTEAEALITDLLAQTWPEARVLGEEAVSQDPALRDAMAGPGWTVIIDPIDGTWNFAKGLATFGMIAAVAQDGVLQQGVLYDPLLEDWVVAQAGGAAQFVRADGSATVLRAAPRRRRQDWVGYVPQAHYPAPLRPAVALAALGFGQVGSLKCSCHEYRMLALGHADFVLTGLEPAPWDHAAAVVITQAMGGVARFLDGAAYDLRRKQGVLLFAASEEIWADVAATYRMLGSGRLTNTPPV